MSMCRRCKWAQVQQRWSRQPSLTEMEIKFERMCWPFMLLHVNRCFFNPPHHILHPPGHAMTLGPCNRELPRMTNCRGMAS